MQSLSWIKLCILYVLYAVCIVYCMYCMLYVLYAVCICTTVNQQRLTCHMPSYFSWSNTLIPGVIACSVQCPNGAKTELCNVVDVICSCVQTYINNMCLHLYWYVLENQIFIILCMQECSQLSQLLLWTMRVLWMLLIVTVSLVKSGMNFYYITRSITYVWYPAKFVWFMPLYQITVACSAWHYAAMCVCACVRACMPV